MYYANWHHSILYYLLITILFMQFLYLVYFYGSNIVCSHDICMCTFPYFTHSLGVFWLPWICTSRSKDVSLCGSGIYMHYEELRILLLDRSALVSFLHFIFSHIFLDSLYFGLSMYSIWIIHIIVISCVRKLYAILQWLSCHLSRFI